MGRPIDADALEMQIDAEQNRLWLNDDKTWGGVRMTYEEAADILDPETSREALLPYAYDPQYQQMLLRDACQMAAEVLRGAVDTNVCDKWISVKERMPEHSGEYLVSSAELGAQFVDTSFYFDDKQQWALFGEHLTHWMPFPEPPEKD